MNRGAWRATSRRVTESQTQLERLSTDTHVRTRDNTRDGLRLKTLFLSLDTVTETLKTALLLYLHCNTAALATPDSCRHLLGNPS